MTLESLKGQTRGEDLFDWVSAVIENVKLPWSKLVNVTTDGSPNLTGKNVGLLRRIQDKVKNENPDQDVIFLHCIIHQESLCKSVLQLNHVVNSVVKLVNFMRARETSAPLLRSWRKLMRITRTCFITPVSAG